MSRHKVQELVAATHAISQLGENLCNALSTPQSCRNKHVKPLNQSRERGAQLSQKICATKKVGLHGCCSNDRLESVFYLQDETVQKELPNLRELGVDDRHQGCKDGREGR